MDAASILVVGAIESKEITPQEEHYFINSDLSGVTLFSRNLSEDKTKIRSLNEKLQIILGNKLPAIVAIDQEGGRVSRLRSQVIDHGPAMYIFKDDSDRKNKIKHYSNELARQLLALGINTNFAPVMDVLTEEKNDAIGDRCFGSTPHEVIEFGGAFLEGLQSQKVLGCLKHFPGQGAANADTHLESTAIRLAFDQLMEIHMKPFAKHSKQAAMVMMSHCIYPEIDTMPASLSKIWQQDILRGQIGFSGVIVSDDFNMKAIPQSEQEWLSAIVDAIYAGTDLILVCRGLDRIKIAVEGIRLKSQLCSTFRSRVEESAQRVCEMRRTLPQTCIL